MKYTVIFVETHRIGSHTTNITCMEQIIAKKGEDVWVCVERHGIVPDHVVFLFHGHPKQVGDNEEKNGE